MKESFQVTRRMQNSVGFVLAGVAGLLIVIGTAAHGQQVETSQPGTPQVDFARQIRPILSDKCFACHGPDESHREADLRLDMTESLYADLGGYQVISRGDPGASELFLRISATDEYERMPPPDSGKELSATEVELIELWIRQGARSDQHWAYKRPVRHPVPDVQHPDWCESWIDRFIVSHLEEQGLRPALPADRRTLIRRLYFDLIGLPPTPAEVAAFEADTSPDALMKVVDALLQSEHFGERLAMYWLDLVRYADTVGYHGDQDHNISPYRDWVIDAFNDDLPFDQFTREQLAGDLLPEPTIDQKIATGYNRLLQTSHEGGVQPKEYLAIYAADRVRNLSAVWMGATVGCAQCHDHKYDPYTTVDFYSLQAFFADIDEAEHFSKGTNALPTKRPPEIEVLSRRQRAELATIEAQLKKLTRESEQPTADDKSDQIKSLEARRDEISASARVTMITVALRTPRTIRVLPRGNWLDDSGPIVEPAVPAFLGSLGSSGSRATRLDLANWLTDADNGMGALSARVLANRLWYLLMGAGISPSLDDFGGQGEPPNLPRLLDNLALKLVDDGWRIKPLIREIVLSRTYRQTSQVSAETMIRDPENRLFARQSTFRLPAELIRDQALAVSGLLVEEVGGPSAKPYQPPDYYRHLNFPPRKYEPDQSLAQWRRGLYVHWQRQFLHPALKSLDAPMREECTAQRPRSNTPLAALTLLNDPTFVEAARVFAARTLQEAATDFDSRLAFAYQWAMSRNPTPSESAVIKELHQTHLKEYRSNPEEARRLLGVGLWPRADTNVAELAAWTAVCRVLLNLDETLTRN